MAQDLSEHSLTKFLEESFANSEEVNYLIKNHNKYILLINNEYNAKILIPMKKYKSIRIENHVAYFRTESKIFVKGIEKSVDMFEVDLKDPNNDIIGFHSMRDVLKNFSPKELNISDVKLYKIIFSPQLARYLLQHNYTIIDLKQRENTNETVFVFLVEDGFYQTVSKWNLENKKDKQ